MLLSSSDAIGVIAVGAGLVMITKSGILDSLKQALTQREESSLGN